MQLQDFCGHSSPIPYATQFGGIVKNTTTEKRSDNMRQCVDILCEKHLPALIYFLDYRENGSAEKMLETQLCWNGEQEIIADAAGTPGKTMLQ